jgi:hypothetical protein
MPRHPRNNSGNEFSKHTTQEIENKNTKPKDARSSDDKTRNELKMNFNKATISIEDASHIVKTFPRHPKPTFALVQARG